MANLHFFYGTMGAAKSTKLIQDRYNFIQKNMNVLVIKPTVDRDNEEKVKARIGLECPAEIHEHIDWIDVLQRNVIYDVIMVDEVQFYKPKDIDNLVKLADTYNKLVFCYGLKVDVNENLFPASAHLIAVGAKLHELTCSCQNPNCQRLATHHLRFNKDGKVIRNGESVVVDNGSVIYKSVCRQCYDRAMNKTR